MPVSARKKTSESWKSAVLGAGLCTGLGLALVLLNLGSSLKDLGYDLLFRLPFRNKFSPSQVIIVYMDDRSFNDLQFTQRPQMSVRTWDLNRHAELVDQLTRDRARVVVFDVVFDLPTPPASLGRFAAAVRRNQKVVLAAGLNQDRRPEGGFEMTEPTVPWPA